jgi:predicted nuclease with TOPRIM domain
MSINPLNEYKKHNEFLIEQVKEKNEEINRIKEENQRYKEINDGLLKVQMDLRSENTELKQWFRASVAIRERMEKKLEEIENERV